MPCNIVRGSKISISTMTIQRLTMSATPGDSLRTYFTSQAAATKGSYNLCRRRPAPRIDALVEKIDGGRNAQRADRSPAARSTASSAPAAIGCRNGIITATGWLIGTSSAIPQNLPRYPISDYASGVGAPDLWWSDRDKAAKLEQAK